MIDVLLKILIIIINVNKLNFFIKRGLNEIVILNKKYIYLYVV